MTVPYHQHRPVEDSKSAIKGLSFRLWRLATTVASEEQRVRRATCFCPKSSFHSQKALIIIYTNLSHPVMTLLWQPFCHKEFSISASHLPAPSTPFVGRAEELSNIAALIADPNCRLLTLVGPGGIGKTRLAIESVKRIPDDFAHGVHFVNLQPIDSADLVASTIASAIGVSLYGSEDPNEQVANYLRKKHLLLVLDNFEHLLGGAGFVTEMLQAAPEVKILVTSRESLNLSSETVFTVGGMDYPDSETPLDAFDYSAVKLFVQSARRSQSGFSIRVDEIKYVAQVCKLVQGMPLGILLAAAWVGTLSLREIAEEIGQSLDFLETTMRDVPSRHRSLRAVFDTSWNRLPDTHREVFMKLSIFRGGFTRQAAQAVTGVSLRVLSALVHKSLLRRLPTGRYDVHELLRQYAGRMLDASLQERARAYDQHCLYYAEFMQRKWPELRSHVSKAALDDIEIEFDNVRVAWHTMNQKGRVGDIIKSEKALLQFLDIRSRRQDGVELFGQAVEALRFAAPGKETDIALGFVLQAQGQFYTRLGLLQKGKRLAEEGLAKLRQHDCPGEMILALEGLALVYYFLNDWGKVECASREGLQIAQTCADKPGIAWHLQSLGTAALNQGYWHEARRFGEESLRNAEEAGFLSIMPIIHGVLLGSAAQHLGDFEEAKRRFQQSIELSSELGHTHDVAIFYRLLTKIALLLGEYEEAERHIKTSIRILQDIDLRFEITRALDAIAGLLVVQGRKERAAELLTFYLQDSSASLDIERHDAERLLAELKLEIPPQIFEAACQRGKALDIEIVVAELLEEDALHPAIQASNHGLIDPLSKRELEVLRLIAAGLSNAEIGQKLRIALATVKVHSRNIFSKLDVSSRTQAIALAQKLRLL